MARRETSTAMLALRGLAVALSLAVGAGVLVAVGDDSFSGDPTIKAELPASAGPIKPDSPVQYHGVTVGRLAAVDGRIDGATLRLRMNADMLEQVPENVRVRLLPRTLFGDQYIDLGVPTDARPEGHLGTDATLHADTSRRTVQLYQAYARLYDVITDLRPADLQVALTALSDTLRGRGAEIGTMIDDAAELTDTAAPLFDSLGEDISMVAQLSRDISAAAPDLLATLDNAVSLSQTVVDERESLHEVLAAGIDGTATAQRLLSDHGERVIELTRTVRPISEVLARYPNVVEEALDAAGFFLEGGQRVFSTGLFRIDAGLTLDQPFPYTSEDCPRYPGMDGQNCGQPPSSRHDRQFPQPLGTPAPEQQQARRAGEAHPAQQPPVTQGGTSGPVGSEREKETLEQLGPLVPGQPEHGGDDPDVLTLLLGPLVRGSEVVVP